MKNLTSLLLLSIGLSVNAQLTSVTEGGNTGQRLSVSDAGNHGDIGFKAVDLSYSNSASTTRGTTGNFSIAMGYETTASDYASTVIGKYNSSGSTTTSADSFSTSAPPVFSK